MADHALLHLKVLDSDHVLFEGDVVSLSSVNDKGPFDVLQMHAHFITLIEDKLVLREPEKEEETIEIDHGIMKVNEDRVVVFVGMKELHLEEAVPKKGEDEKEKSGGEDANEG